MQIKFIFFIVASLFITMISRSQDLVSTTTINNNKLPATASTFKVSLSPDKSSNIFTLWIQNPGKKKLNLRITHKVTGPVIDTTITEEDFRRRYSMELADDGDYKIKVSCGKERVVKELQLNTITTRRIALQ